MADTTVPFNATFGLAAGAESTAIILEDATIKPNISQTYTALQNFSGGISASGGITFNGTLTGVTATFTRLLTASDGFSAAGGVTLASPNLTGTPTATTASVGTNTTQIATTAFVQNEIVADAVTGFNGRTGSVQGVSAAVAGTGISVSGATGSVTITNIGVQSFNGLTGAVTGVTVGGTNTFTALQTFSSGISASGGSTFASNVSFSSTTSYTGLASFSGGISASGGVTFSGTVNVTSQLILPSGQTLSGGVVTTINGNTGAVGALLSSFGTTGDSTIRVITYPDGVTTQRADRSQYFWTFTRTYQSGGSMTIYANRTYFQPQSVSKSTTIKSLRFMSANTGITGNCYFSVWSADPNNGNPSSRLYASASTVVGSGYNYTTVTNGSGLVTVPAGNWWLAVSFSSTPTIYSHHKDYILPYAGGSDFNSGYKNYYPVVDTNGFTAPTAISGSGITYAWVEYHPSFYISPHFEWQTI